MIWNYREEQKRFIIELMTGKTLEQWEENNEILKRMMMWETK